MPRLGVWAGGLRGREASGSWDSGIEGAAFFEKKVGGTVDDINPP